jgi:hypothetical protein
MVGACKAGFLRVWTPCNGEGVDGERMEIGYIVVEVGVVVGSFIVSCSSFSEWSIFVFQISQMGW